MGVGGRAIRPVMGCDLFPWPPGVADARIGAGREEPAEEVITMMFWSGGAWPWWGAAPTGGPATALPGWTR